MFENNRLTVTCPRCGHEMTKTVQWIKDTTGYRCIGCNELVRPGKKSLLKALKRIEKSVTDLFSQYNKPGTVKY